VSEPTASGTTATPDENDLLNFSFMSADKLLLLTIKKHGYEDVVKRGNGMRFDRATAFRLFEP
jgi:hypothetical protein